MSVDALEYQFIVEEISVWVESSDEPHLTTPSGYELVTATDISQLAQKVRRWMSSMGFEVQGFDSVSGTTLLGLKPIQLRCKVMSRRRISSEDLAVFSTHVVEQKAGSTITEEDGLARELTAEPETDYSFLLDPANQEDLVEGYIHGTAGEPSVKEPRAYRHGYQCGWNDRNKKVDPFQIDAINYLKSRGKITSNIADGRTFINTKIAH